jgi:hypothetical protein
MRNERARIAQGGTEAKRQWSAIADPITGDIMLYNAMTGETRRGDQVGGLAPGPAPGPGPGPVGAAGAPPARLTESQTVAARRTGEGIVGMSNAVNAGFPSENFVGGGVQAGQNWLNSRGFPQFSGEETQQQQSFWSNVADPLVRARTGAAMPVEEFRNQMTMLLPRPGEHPTTQMRKAQQLIALLKSGTVGLPPKTVAHLMQQLEMLESRIPTNMEEWQQMRMGGEGQPQQGQQQAPQQFQQPQQAPQQQGPSANTQRYFERG